MLDRSPTPALFQDVTSILAPRSIAVVGASDQPGNLGGVAIRFLRKFGYPGEVWPVNPRRAEVGGLTCFPSVASLPVPADLVLIATGAEAVANLVDECAKSGVGSGVVWAGGFAETGGRGAALQDDLARLCRETGFVLLGPNSIGVINSWLPMAATFASFLDETERLLPGNISMVSQSGGLATMAQAHAQAAGFGFRYTISSGNEAVLSAADFIHALVEDEHTRVIAAYLEGTRDGEALLASLEEARDAGKPVVVMKGGATAASARAAAAHTGALVGEERVWDAVFRQKAVIQAQSLEHLLDLTLFLSSTDPRTLPRGNRVAAVTFGGGGGVLSADQCTRHGLAVPALSAQTQEKLRTLVPPIASIGNPIDLTPQTFNQASWMEKFPTALDVIAADPEIDIVLLQFGPMARNGAEVARAIVEFRHRTMKTVCYAWPLAPRGVPDLLRASGIYVFGEYARAIAVLGKQAERHSQLTNMSSVSAEPLAFEWSLHVPDPVCGQVISEHQCHALLRAAGLDVAPGALTRSEAQAVEAARSIGYPVALKGISPKVTHRAAANLLQLNVHSDAEARQAYRRLLTTAEAADLELEGIYVQHMVEGRLELLVSAFRDPDFGVVVSCGSGGILTEVIADVSLERAPFDEMTALRIFDRLRLARKAGTIDPAANREKLARFLALFSRLAASCPWRRFVFEINPIKWGADGAVAVDGLLIIEEPH